MRILYLCADTGIDVLGRKGAAIHVREMIAAFARAGHSVDLVAPRLMKSHRADRHGLRAPTGLEPAHVDARVRRVPVPEHIQSVKHDLDLWADRFGHETSVSKDVRRMLYDRHLREQLATMYNDNPPDVIYARASLLSSAGVDLAKHAGVPLILEVNAPLADEQEAYRSGVMGDLYRAVESELLGGATHVMVVSEVLVSYVSGSGVDPSRIHVLPNGVDVQRFFPRSSQRNTAVGPVLGFVGGLRPWHGVENLPELLHLVQRRHPAATLRIAGDGPLRGEIQERARSFGVEASIDLLGAVSHESMPDIVRSFDVALAPYPALPHDFYFSPLKLYEYFACGVPVVASDVGQIARVARAKGGDACALLAPAGDIDAMSDACCRLIEDSRQAYQIGMAGARLVRESCTWDHNVDRVLGLVRATATR